MAAQGQFPKSDGDVDYASEGNRFAYAGTTFFIGSTAAFASGPNVIAGSFLIPAGSLSNPAWFDITTMFGGGNNLAPIIKFSGTSTMVTASGITPGGNLIYHLRGALGSPMNGGLIYEKVNIPTGTPQVVGTSGNNFNTNAGTVIFFGIDYGGNTTDGYAFISIQAGGIGAFG